MLHCKSSAGRVHGIPHAHGCAHRSPWGAHWGQGRQRQRQRPTASTSACGRACSRAGCRARRRVMGRPEARPGGPPRVCAHQAKAEGERARQACSLQALLEQRTPCNPACACAPLCATGCGGVGVRKEEGERLPGGKAALLNEGLGGGGGGIPPPQPMPPLALQRMQLQCERRQQWTPPPRCSHPPRAQHSRRPPQH